MHQNLLLPLVILAVTAQASAQIVYVDADQTTNTTLATGAPLIPNPVSSGIDNNWTLRLLGNGATAYESHAGGTVVNEDAPMLRTTIVGLAAGVRYHVYAYFWGASTASANWRGRAVVDVAAPTPQIQGYNTRQPAVSSLLPMTPLAVGASVGVGQTSLGLSFNATGFETSGHFATPTMIMEGNRWLYEVSLGHHAANANGEIFVWVDDLEGNVNSDSRTWYDGVGWEVAPQQYGTGCGTPLPTIDSVGPPIWTRNFEVTLANAPANGIAVLVIGLSSTSWSGIPLPLPLASIGYLGCDLLVSLDLTQAAITSPVGAASITFNLSAPSPTSIFFQWAAFDASGAISMTPGLSVLFHP